LANRWTAPALNRDLSKIERAFLELVDPHKKKAASVTRRHFVNVLS
jgi:hypothetical protein